MKKSNTVLIIVIAIVAIIAIALVGGYNSLVSKKENVTTAYSNLDVSLQRRADLIPNIVNTIKGVTKQESEIVDKVTTARQNLVNASSLSEKSVANDELTSALNSLNLIVENYPDLKSSPNFLNLQDELAGTENRIATARRDYNTAVQTYNTSIKAFPNSIYAGMFGFEKADYFEASSESKEVPSVNF